MRASAPRAAETGHITAILRRARPGRRTGGPFAGAVLLAGAVALSGCASQEPVMPAPPGQTVPVVVGADESIAQQQVLAEVYAGALRSRGREAEVRPVATDERIDAVRTGQVTLSFGCTGELLGLLAPDTARQLADEYRADPDPGKATSAEWRDRVYVAMSEALPGEVMATDPSNAQGCGAEKRLSGPEAEVGSSGMEGGTGESGGGGAAEEAESEATEGAGASAAPSTSRVPVGDVADMPADNPGAALPQHIVPFYLKPTVDRHLRVNALNRVAGSLTTAEVRELTDDSRRTRNPASVADEWLATSRFATG